MIFVTGDTHGEHDIHKLNTIGFPEQKGLTRDDYVIICGDFGVVWNDDAVFGGLARGHPAKSCHEIHLFLKDGRF